MGKKILVLTGSPRKGGNSDLLADAFISGARRVGHTVVKYETAGKTIKSCQACNACFSQGPACVFNDDFNALAPLAEEVEVIVFATPLYWFSFPTSIKAAIDKFYSFMVAGRQLKIEQSVLMVCGGDNQASGFEGIVRSYELIAEYMQWSDAGQIVLASVSNKGDIHKTNGLQRAEKLGESIQ